MSPGATIGVTIVSWNSAAYLSSCLDSLAAQTQQPSEVVVVDNGSSDESLRIAQSHSIVSLVDPAGENLGFSVGQNRAIAQTDSPWVLVLNPDTRLATDFLARMSAAITNHPEPELGTLCGKLLRMDSRMKPVEPAEIDSVGMEMFRSFRHLDRGSGRLDDGRWDTEELVFGATGAAALFRRSMVEDLQIDGAFFDPQFFAYREDADVAWRAQTLGWKNRGIQIAECSWSLVTMASAVRTQSSTPRALEPGRCWTPRCSLLGALSFSRHCLQPHLPRTQRCKRCLVCLHRISVVSACSGRFESWRPVLRQPCSRVRRSGIC